MTYPSSLLRCALRQALLLAFLAIGHSAAAAPQWNLLFITADDMNADSVGWMGCKPGTTPNLDAFAATAHQFRDHRVVVGEAAQLVAPHQRRNHHPRRHRLRLPLHQPQQQPRRPRPGRGEIDMRIGVIDRDAVDVLQHPVGHDAVEIEPDDDRDLLADDLLKGDLREMVQARLEAWVNAHIARLLDRKSTRLNSSHT